MQSSGSMQCCVNGFHFVSYLSFITSAHDDGQAALGGSA